MRSGILWIAGWWIALALAVGAQQAAPPPAPTQRLSFDVAAIRPAPDLMTVVRGGGQPHLGTRIDAGHVDIGSASMRDLICTAYGIKPYQLSGPDWMTSQRFDIQATLPAGSTPAQVPEMLQSLLADRFQLAIHRDSQQQSVYALVVGPNGPHMDPAAPAASAAADAPPTPNTTTLDTAGGPITVSRGTARRDGGMTDGTVAVNLGANGNLTMQMVNGMMQMKASAMTMAQLANAMTPFVDHPILDQTGLKGAYQLQLELPMADLRAMAMMAASQMGVAMPPSNSDSPTPPDPAGSSIFAAVQKLGLKLDPRKAAVDRIVVDHLEKTPTAN